MADYYRILGIDPSANSTQIRTAYKKLAMTYHPDRNAGDKEAEEMFKTINEAYHVLSDPLKKSRYDARMNSYQTTINTEDYWRELQRQQYYRWKSSQRSYYRIDKNYFRIQGLAFLVFIILAGFCFGVIHTINYVIAEQHAKKWRENGKLLKQVTGLFGQEKFKEAFTMINFLREQDPMEYRFGFTRDSLILELRNMADKRMAYQDFIGAVEYYQVLRNYERPPSLETLNKIASCQYYLGNYSESLVAMKHLHNQQPWNLELIYQIGMINLEKLDNKIEALHYFSMGKKLFKDNLSKVYGEAFEIIMDPTDAPDVYFDIFEARARTNIRLKDYEEAMTDCNWAVFLRPNKHEPYRLRAICKVELRNYNEACIDLRKATFHGSRSVDELSKRFCR